jgi:thiol:disulfide interchange protein DsbC
MKNPFLVSQLLVAIFILYIPQSEGGEVLPLDAIQENTENISKYKNRISKLLKQRLGTDAVAEPIETPVKGIYQTQFGKNYAYLANDGNYLFVGDLIDLKQDQNLTNNARRNIENPAPKPLATEAKGNLKIREMTELLKLRLGSIAVSEPVKTPVDGIYHAQYGFNFAYLTEDGRYAFMANLIDLERGLNLTNIAKRGLVKTEMRSFASEDKAIFLARGPEKAVIDIFTDTACSSCKKLFMEVPKLQDAGITVQYLPFPDDGIKGLGYGTLKQVWCAEDKAQALTIGKGLAVGELPSGDCIDSRLVDKSFALGKNIGVIGTPAIFTNNGAQIKGYVPYQKLIPRILSN